VCVPVHLGIHSCTSSHAIVLRGPGIADMNPAIQSIMAQRHTNRAGELSAGAGNPSPKRAADGNAVRQALEPKVTTMEDLKRENQSLRKDREELLLRFAVMPRTTQQAAVQISESQKALDSVRKARDAVMARSAELAEKLRQANEKCDELTDSHELIEFERNAAMEKLHSAQREATELMEKLDEISQHQSMENSSPETATAEVIAKARAIIVATEMREGHTKERQKETIRNLIEQFGEERRELRRQLDELKANSSVQISALQAQLAAHSKDSVPIAEMERHRLEVAKLRVELDTLHEELWRGRNPEVPAAASPASLPIPPPVDASPALEAKASVPSAPEPVEGVESKEIISEEDVESEMAAMNWFLQEIERDSSHLEALDVLASLFQDSAQRAFGAGCIAANRVGTACADVAAWLRRTPTKIASALPTLREGASLIGKLLRGEAASRVGDPAGASVYAVDNDLDNCECLVGALEKSALQTRYAVKADVAFAELSKAPCDLILLDVDLGDSDGFDLHDRIRKIEHHRETPVIFISGLMSTKDRLKGIAGPPASFVAKPYHLNDLTLKVLCTILTSRLRKV
jgi:CheY-like chemotaxis protein